MSAASGLGGIGACVFDAYGTLFDVHSAVRRHADALGDAAPAVSALWRQKQLEYSWLRSLMREHADFWQVTGDALDYALARHDVEAGAARERLMAAYLELGAYSEVSSSLERLRASGQKLAILSNGSPYMLHAALRHAGLEPLFHEVLSIEDVGVYKPAPAVYQLACDRLGVRPEAVCFLSSNAWDIAGAAAFGFKAVWINRFGQPQERLPGQPAAEISRLDELPPLLGLTG